MTSYPAEFPITLREVPACRNVAQMDLWGNDDYVDRCLASWCWSSSSVAMDAIWSTIQFTEFDWITTTYYYMPITSTAVYKTTLTASDEGPVDHYFTIMESSRAVFI